MSKTKGPQDPSDPLFPAVYGHMLKKVGKNFHGKKVTVPESK